jgi:hypothetical protein
MVLSAVSKALGVLVLALFALFDSDWGAQPVMSAPRKQNVGAVSLCMMAFPEIVFDFYHTL